MNGDELCTCGHVYDEHQEGGRACLVDDEGGEQCDCCCFEEE
jgi:hypothetical protein